MSLMPSPPGSGRSSPLPHRFQLRREEDEPRRQDKGYRRYAAGIEKALATFDGARQEWADYISFLGRLLKAIQAHPPVFENIPHKSAVASRLSQCLIPSLPSGVHQRAVETYSTIFFLLKKEQLAHDLPVWLPGLAPVLSFASLSLRPSFLTLIETFVLTLDAKSLRPALKSLILAILPGLEDETSEDFDRTVKIVDCLRNGNTTSQVFSSTPDYGPGDGFFWQCFFLATISSASRRAGALAYMIKRLPKLGSPAEASLAPSAASTELSDSDESVVSPEPGLLIRCFAAGLMDEHMLLQRGFLDLLVTHLPLNSSVLTQRVDASDLERLATAAIGVVVRRDMSLNRRLWSWFLGPQGGSNDESEMMSSDSKDQGQESNGFRSGSSYFSDFGLRPLVNGLLGSFHQKDQSVFEAARPFRICLSLMDRGEIGRLLVPQIFRPSMERAFFFDQFRTRDEFQEVLRSATSFFDGIESGAIWKEMHSLLILALKHGGHSDNDRLEILKLVGFIMDHFNVREEEMITIHIPLVSISLINLLSQGISNIASGLEGLSDQVLEMAILILDKLVSAISDSSQARLNQSVSNPQEPVDTPVHTIEKFYGLHNGNIALMPPPYDIATTRQLLVEGAMKLASQCLKLHKGLRFLESTPLKVTSVLLNKLPNGEYSNTLELLHTFQENLKKPRLSDSHSGATQFPTVAAMVQVLSQLSSSGAFVLDPLPPTLSGLLADLVGNTWAYLTPSSPRYHIEGVHCLWQLHKLSGKNSIVEATLTASTVGRHIQREAQADKLESARRFAVLWNHTIHTDEAGVRNRESTWSKRESIPFPSVASGNPEYQLLLHRPLFLLLDTLGTEHTEVYHQVRSWISSMPDLVFVFDLLLTKLAESSYALLNPNETAQDEESQMQISNEDHTRETLYFMEHILTLLRLSTQNVWSTLTESRTFLPSASDIMSDENSFQISIALASLQILEASIASTRRRASSTAIQHNALAILQCLLQGPNGADMRNLTVDEALVEILRKNTPGDNPNSSLQIALLDTILPAVRLRVLGVSPSGNVQAYPKSPGPAMFGHVAATHSSEIFNPLADQAIAPPANLMKCLQEGISAASSFYALDHWIHSLIEVLPFYADSLFQTLIPLVECFCAQIKSSFGEITATFAGEASKTSNTSEQTLTALLSGLEHILASAHNQLSLEESQLALSKPAEQAQGFFGNVVSGVFSSDVQKTRSALANTRLTVLLCVHDVVRMCVMIWTWSAPRKVSQQDYVGCVTHNYVSVRLRNKSRRILDRMYTAEALECLETLVDIWAQPSVIVDGTKSSSVITLISGLDGGRPKNTMPAIFNAIYSRNNPAAIDATRTSTLTFDVTDVELSQFLVQYALSLDDDAMDEIWTDCMTFLRDVMANPLPHHAILPNLLVFLLTLAEKIERTNFGEQRRLRRELSESAYRLLHAIFTTRTTGSLSEPPPSASASVEASKARHPPVRSIRRVVKSSEFAEVLVTMLPKLQSVLVEGDRLPAAITLISTQFVSPSIHSKSFPENMKLSHIKLVSGIAKASPTSKVWKKDVSEAFNHAKFFSGRLKEVNDGWLPLIRLWTSSDKDRLPELASRLSAPTSAGMLFGVGASAARLEADKKTQVVLRRIATIILAMEHDFAVSHLQTLEEKLVELFGATAASSPSSTTRAEVFMVLRAMALKTSSIHLAPLWPLITAELQRALSSALSRDHNYDIYNALSLCQACKLLDLLLVIAPEDFQLQEWLFVTDTIDAVYRSSQSETVSLADEIAEELGSTGGLYAVESAREESSAYRSGLLKMDDRLVDASKEDIVNHVLGPFFNQLSIHAYEGTYSMKSPDLHECEQAVLKDLFNDSTIIG